jgi:hypothetical protein
MPIRIAAAALISAAAFVSGCGSVANASGPGDALCASLTQSVNGWTAAQAIHIVAENMADTCGFTISGDFEGEAFGIDGWGLYGTSTYGPFGGVHLVWNNQGVILDVYRVSGHDYLRLYMESDSGASASQIASELRAEWNAFGITSNAVIKAVGTTKWVEFTAAQAKKVNTELGVPLTSGALGNAIAQGSGEPWKLGGTKTLNGVRCLVLTDPVNNSGPGYLGESLYVNESTGEPVEIRYVSQDSQQVTANFGNWNHVGVLTGPPAAKVVQG